jgi:hypothetical protein
MELYAIHIQLERPETGVEQVVSASVKVVHLIASLCDARDDGFATANLVGR